MFQFGSNGFFSYVKKWYPQWVAGTGIALVGIQLGTLDVWSSSNIARLTSIDSPIPMSLDEASWLASFISLGEIMGSMIGAAISQTWGTRAVNLSAFLPMTINWILIIVFNSKFHLYVARVFAGVGSGIGYTCLPLFAGEVASPRNRDTMASIETLAVLVASVTGTFFGHRLSLAAFSECFLGLCFLGVCIFLWLPHTPHYLVRSKNLNAAKDSLNWYRGYNNTDGEFEDVIDYISLSSSTSFKEAFREFRLPYFRKVLTLVCVLFAYLEICGVTVLMGYAEIVLTKGKFHLLPPYLAVSLMYVVGLSSTCVMIFIVDRCGRKFLMVTSSLGVIFGLVGLGTHFLLIDFGYDPENFQVLPAASIFLIQGTFYFGMMMVPNMVLCEVFPANVKGPAASITILVSCVGAFTVLKSFQPLVDTIGEAAVFYGNAAIVVMLIPYVLICMPETKGKSLNQIQRELKVS